MIWKRERPGSPIRCCRRGCPRVEPEQELSGIGRNVVSEWNAQKRKTDVLLIQDDPSQAALITKMLSEGAQEFSAHHVRHPEEGLSLLQSREFDVILLDLGPLDSRGLETALAVRNRAKYDADRRRRR